MPDLSDVHHMLQILAHLGADVERASGIVTVKAEKVDSVAPYEIVRKCGPRFASSDRFWAGKKRPLFRSPEVASSETGQSISIYADLKHWVPPYVSMPATSKFSLRPSTERQFPSGKFGTTVLGTDNIMMAAVLADGTTIIEDAACEPEVVDLASFLNKMGAKIEGAGTARIVIEGVKELHGAEHEVIPDRIEAGTFLIAGAIAGKEITVNRVRPDHLTAVTDALKACGFRVNGTNGSLVIRPNGATSP